MITRFKLKGSVNERNERDELITIFFWSSQVSGNLVAFEDADIEEASESYDCWNLVHCSEHNISLGDVFPAGANISRYQDVCRAVARPVRWNALLFVCQSSCLLLDPFGNDIDLLHSHMDKGNEDLGSNNRIAKP